MSQNGKSSIEDTLKRMYGDSINEYARGCEPMVNHAIGVCIPAIVAMTLPEEYASIVLTSRMDNELQKMLQKTLHRQGDPKRLFKYDGPFGTFAVKVDASYSFGFLTKKMHTALTCCRKIRNAFAHSDNPDAAKESKDYKEYKPKLLELDAAYVTNCVDDYKKLRDSSGFAGDRLPEFSEVIAVMLAVTETLGNTAFAANTAISNLLRFPCAFCGSDDVPALESISKS